MPKERPSVKCAADFPFGWQRVKACPLYPQFLMVRGDYGLHLNRHADEDDWGGHTAWEIWHWPSNTVESDWFTAGDAWREIGALNARQRNHGDGTRCMG